MSERSRQAVKTSCETGYSTFLFMFKAIVGLLLTTRESCSISGVELTAGDAFLVDVVSGNQGQS